MALKRTSTRKKQVPIRNAKNPLVSVIIPVMNERRTVAQVIRNCRAVHPKTEVIVVVNGSTDDTERIVRRSGARSITFKHPLGHDVGRTVGSVHAKGDILLFTDGDIVIPTKQLKPFIRAIEQGVDVALNQYTGPTHNKNVHNVILAKHVFNAMLHRPDLGGVSMTTIPHALSRKAVETIGNTSLCLPPKAFALAIVNKLNIQAVEHVEVGKTNRRRRKIKGSNPLESLIVGDHLEALHFALNELGHRYGHSDMYRKRELVKKLEATSSSPKKNP